MEIPTFLDFVHDAFFWIVGGIALIALLIESFRAFGDHEKDVFVKLRDAAHRFALLYIFLLIDFLILAILVSLIQFFLKELDDLLSGKMPGLNTVLGER